MSENLKRAESLFNRIMNQSKAPEGKPQNPPNQHSRSHNSSNHNSTHHRGSRSHRYHHNNSSSGSSTHNSSTNGNNTGNPSNNGFSIPSNTNINTPIHNSHGSTNGDSQTDFENKRNPVKEAQDAVALVPAHHHVLPYCWTMWHHRKAKKLGDEPLNEGESPVQQTQTVQSAQAVQAAHAAAAAVASTQEAGGEMDPETMNKNAAAAVDSYLQTTKEITFDNVVDGGEPVTGIASVEQLWSSLSQYKKAYEMTQMTQLLIFKTGVTPVWEDPINAKGGRWVFRFGRRIFNTDAESNLRVRQRTTLIWERLVLRTITGSLIPDKQLPRVLQEQILSDITGLALSVRREEDIISMWNSNISFGRRGGRGGDDDERKKLQPFQARRIMCDAILRIIRECDLIMQGSDAVDTVATGSTERVSGVLFEYRLHSDSNHTVMHGSDRHRRRNQHRDDDH